MKITTRCLLLISLFLMNSSISLKSASNVSFLNSAIAQEEDFDASDESLFDDGDDGADFSEDEPDEEFGDFAEDDGKDTDFMDFNEDELEPAGSTNSADSDFDEFDENEPDIVDESTPIINEPIVAEPENTIDEPENTIDEPQPIVEEVAPISEPVDTFVSVEPSKNFNTEYEDQLYNIYQNYYNFPVTSSDWDNLTGDRKSEVYVIQRGDSLWDISATFFGDGNYWPKIWSVNGRITNPHLIDVGNNILFNLGNINSPPTFTVSDDGSGPVENQLGTNSIPGSSLVASTGPVKIPKSKVRRRPVLKNLPGSFPAWSMLNKKNEMSFSVKATSFKSSRNENIPVTHMIKHEKMASSGVVVEAEAGEKLATAGQYVYVEFNNAPGSDRYLVAREVERTSPDLASGEISGPNGRVYEIQGEVAIRDTFNNKNGDKLYRAYVESSFTPISSGSILLNQSLAKVNVKSSGDYNLTPGQIIGGSMLKGSKLLSQWMFAFINKGSSDGMEVEDRVMFISQRRIRKAKSNIKGMLFKVGEGQVVDVSSDVSTVLVTKVYREIYVGDYIGEPEFSLINRAGKSNFSNSGSGASDEAGIEDFGDDEGDDTTFDASGDFGDDVDDDESFGDDSTEGDDSFESEDGFGDSGEGEDESFDGEGFEDESFDDEDFEDDSAGDDDFEDDSTEDGDFDDEF